MKPNLLLVGERIRKIIDSKGITLEQFGILIGDTPTSSVNNWLRGVSLPNKNRLKKIATIGNTTVDWIKWGSFEEYINTYLNELGYQHFISDYPNISRKIFLDLKDNYNENFSLQSDYELLNPIINTIFRKNYTPIYNQYLKDLITSEIEPKIDMYANKEHSISRKRFISRFHSNFNDLLRRKEFKYGETKQILDSAIELLREMDEPYKLKQKYLSIEDFFSQNTQTQFQTEKFLSDLSEKYNFPYKANSTTSKFLTKNHNKFNK